MDAMQQVGQTLTENIFCYISSFNMLKIFPLRSMFRQRLSNIDLRVIRLPLNNASGILLGPYRFTR
ncbi:protein of unknown function [Paraburkholderia dioscoreae]|uniref:Uncharacterized protein n=1 Tax=Paraburkholderia dioscoreae TaxID=2604047 RepID=A0A5Q4ZIH7_9BURK|nr:protein of unknown function [Paraburkholderia dioscoreae]